MIARDAGTVASSAPKDVPTVVFIHGALCDARVWAPQIGAFAKLGWRAVALPLEGFYPDTYKPESFSADRHVKAIGSFLRGLGRPGHLVGHSRGGRLALAVAAEFPESVASLTLLEAGGIREPDFLDSKNPPKTPAPAPLERALKYIAEGNAAEGLHSYIDAGNGEGAWDRAPELFKRAALDNAASMRSIAEDKSRPLSRADARRVTCPTLLVEGVLSPKDFHEITDVLEREIRGAHRVRIEGADHFLPMTHPNPVNEAVAGFIVQVVVRG